MGKLAKRTTTTAIAAPIQWEDARFVRVLFGFLKGIHNPNTRKSYERALKQFFGIVGKEPQKVTPPDVVAFVELLKKEGKSASTINQVLSALNQFYEELRRPESPVADPLVKYNPVGVRRIKVDSYSRSTKITLDQFQKIREQIDAKTLIGQRDLAILLFYVYTGRRRQEIARLVWGDIKRKGKRITYEYVGKGGGSYTKDLNLAVVEALDWYIDNSGRKMKKDSPLFVGSRGGESALSDRQIDRILKKYAAAAGIPADEIKLHSLRHLAAEIRRETGYSVEDVQAFLDHRNLSTTQIYLRKTEGVREKNPAKARKLLG
jgi:integrase/recombinase XerD